MKLKHMLAWLLAVWSAISLLFIVYIAVQGGGIAEDVFSIAYMATVIWLSTLVIKSK